MENMAFSFFENYFSKLDKEDAFSLMALDLASVNCGPFSKIDSSMNTLNYLNLCNRTDTLDDEEYDEEDIYTNVADAILLMQMDLFEERYFSISSEDSEVSELQNLEHNILKYFILCLNFTTKINEEDIFQLYFKFSDIMFKAKIEKANLWGILIDILFKIEAVVPCVFLETDSEKFKFMLKALRNFCQSFNLGDYRSIQELISINSCLKYGSVGLLQVLLKMGHELSFDNMWRNCLSYWMILFGEIPGFIISRKPDDMSLKRFLLHLHIFQHADSKDPLFEDTYQQFPEKLTLLWRAVPDTFITKQEITSVFAEKIQAKTELERRQFFDELDKILGNFFPEPRLLRHYARCTIRRTLNINCLLPEAIEQLPIPENLRSYINMES